MVKNSLWFVFFLLLAVSCLNEPDCFSLNNNFVGISFRKLSNNQVDSVFMQKISAVGTDSIFLESPVGQVTQVRGNVRIPLNYYENQTVLMFNGISKAYDLTLGYRSQSQFVSEECGERFVLSGLTASSTTFDSVRVLYDTPVGQNANATNIYVYRCPNRNQIKLKFTTAVTIASIQPVGYTGDVVLRSTPITSITVPINPDASQSTIQFTVNGVTKQITVGYSRATQTLFNACGPQIIPSELTVIEHTFTNTTLVNSTFQDPSPTNLEVTF